MQYYTQMRLTLQLLLIPLLLISLLTTATPVYTKISPDTFLQQLYRANTRLAHKIKRDQIEVLLGPTFDQGSSLNQYGESPYLVALLGETIRRA